VEKVIHDRTDCGAAGGDSPLGKPPVFSSATHSRPPRAVGPALYPQPARRAAPPRYDSSADCADSVKESGPAGSAVGSGRASRNARHQFALTRPLQRHRRRDLLPADPPEPLRAGRAWRPPPWLPPWRRRQPSPSGPVPRPCRAARRERRRRQTGRPARRGRQPSPSRALPRRRPCGSQTWPRPVS